MVDNNTTEKGPKADREGQVAHGQYEIVEAFDNICQHIMPSTPGKLMLLSAGKLAKLRNDLDRVRLVLNDLDFKLSNSLEVRYQNKIKNALIVSGRSSGEVHFNDGHDVDVFVELPELINWDQPSLKAMYKRLIISGSDPGEFINASFFINETKYKKWSSVIRETYSRARLVRIGRPTFKFVIKKEKA